MSLAFARPWRSSSSDRGALAALAAASSRAVPRAVAISTEASEVKAAVLAFVAHFDQSREVGDTVPGAAQPWKGEIDVPINPDGSIRTDKPIEVHHADILRRESVRGVDVFVSTIPTLSRDHPGEKPLYLCRAGKKEADSWIEGESVRDCAGNGVLIYVPWYLSWRGAHLAVVFRASFRDEDRPGQLYPQLEEGSPEYYPRITAPTRYDAPHAKMIDYVLIARVEERVRRFLGVMDCGIDFRGARLKDQQLDFGDLLGGSIDQSKYRTALHLEVRLKGIWRRAEVPQDRCTSGHVLPAGDVSPQYVFGLPGADLVEDHSGPLHCFKRERSKYERVLRHRSTASDTWTFLSRTTARHGGHEHVVATQWSMKSLAFRDCGERVPVVVTFALALDRPFQVRRRGSDEKGRQVFARPEK